MKFRIVVSVRSAQEQGVVLVTGLDVGEVGCVVLDIPTDEYSKNPKKISEGIYNFASDYVERLIKLEIVPME
jgi:hypothetical protein